MIPEQAKFEIRRKKAAGQSWTGIAKWIQDEYGVDIHRTTVQRWHDKEVYSDEIEQEFIELPDDRIKLDKKIATYKAEANYFKKLYEKSIKDDVIKKDAKKEIIIDAIKNNAPAFPKLKDIYRPYKSSVSNKQRRGDTPQVVVAPLNDLHIGDNVNLEQMSGLNSYDIDIFNRRLYGWASQLLNLVELRRNVAPVDELIVPMLGDMVSGDIHEELA